MMRLFIAIVPDETMHQELVRTMEELHTCGMQGVYTKEENLHLTLAFIGDYGDPEEVLDAMEEAVTEPFEMTLDGIGCFGDLYWSGFADNGELALLAGRLRRSLAEHGIPYDRKKFFPHCTLVRKARFPHNAVRLPEDIQHVSMTVNGITLFQSRQGRNGMVYTSLGEVTFTEDCDG